MTFLAYRGMQSFLGSKLLPVEFRRMFSLKKLRNSAEFHMSLNAKFRTYSNSKSRNNHKKTKAEPNILCNLWDPVVGP